MAFFVLLSFTGKESKMKNLITVAQYPKSEIPERYIRIRNLKELCLICQHWTSRRDLRKDKRYIVELEHGKCRLQHELCSCKSFQKIPELRGKNMTINEKLYARMYTKTFLRKAHTRYYQRPNEELSRAVRGYLKFQFSLSGEIPIE